MATIGPLRHILLTTRGIFTSIRATPFGATTIATVGSPFVLCVDLANGNKGSGTCVYVVVHMSGAERRVYYKTLGTAGLVGKDWTEVNDAGPSWDAVLQGDRRVAVIE